MESNIMSFEVYLISVDQQGKRNAEPIGEYASISDCLNILDKRSHKVKPARLLDANNEFSSVYVNKEDDLLDIVYAGKTDSKSESLSFKVGPETKFYLIADNANQVTYNQFFAQYQQWSPQNDPVWARLLNTLEQTIIEIIEYFFRLLFGEKRVDEQVAKTAPANPSEENNTSTDKEKTSFIPESPSYAKIVTADDILEKSNEQLLKTTTTSSEDNYTSTDEEQNIDKDEQNIATFEHSSLGVSEETVTTFLEKDDTLAEETSVQQTQIPITKAKQDKNEFQQHPVTSKPLSENILEGNEEQSTKNNEPLEILEQAPDSFKAKEKAENITLSDITVLEESSNKLQTPLTNSPSVTKHSTHLTHDKMELAKTIDDHQDNSKKTISTSLEEDTFTDKEEEFTENNESLIGITEETPTSIVDKENTDNVKPPEEVTPAPIDPIISPNLITQKKDSNELETKIAQHRINLTSDKTDIEKAVDYVKNNLKEYYKETIGFYVQQAKNFKPKNFFQRTDFISILNGKKTKNEMLLLQLKAKIDGSFKGNSTTQPSLSYGEEYVTLLSKQIALIQDENKLIEKLMATVNNNSSEVKQSLGQIVQLFSQKIESLQSDIKELNNWLSIIKTELKATLTALKSITEETDEETELKEKFDEEDDDNDETITLSYESDDNESDDEEENIDINESFAVNEELSKHSYTSVFSSDNNFSNTRKNQQTMHSDEHLQTSGNAAQTEANHTQLKK